MRTFAQKPKATQQADSAKHALPNRARLGQSRDLDSILHLQRTIGNQAVQRLLDATMRDAKGEATTEISRFGHDFSRIPVHASAALVRSLVVRAQSTTSVVGAANPVRSQAALAHADIDGGHALPQAIRSRAEVATGADLGGIRIHTGSGSQQAAQMLKARAFTFGSDIHFGAGHYDPTSRSGQHLIAHEVAHTVQQGGRPAAALAKGDEWRPDGAAEVEADAFADAFLGGRSYPISARADVPAVALAPKPKTQTKKEDDPGTRQVSVSVGLGGIAASFGPITVAGRKTTVDVRLGLRGSVKGVLPAVPTREKGKKRSQDPGPAAAVEALREGISSAEPVVEGSVLVLDLAGEPLRIGVTDKGVAAQQVLSLHSGDKRTLMASGVVFTGSINAHVITTVSGGGVAGSGTTDALSEVSFVGVTATLADVVEGEGKKAKVVKRHNVAAADPATAAKVLAIKSVLDAAEEPLRKEIMDDALSRAVESNAKKSPKKQLSDEEVAASGAAAGRKAIAGTAFAGTQFGKSVGTTEAALRLLEFMRPWFVSDEKTIAHFQGMRRVKGQRNLLAHDSLASRLEAVQKAIAQRYPYLGEKAYPQSTVGWSFRGELQLGASQSHKHMHKIGMAVDFDAYNLPMMNPGETKALVKVVTGRTNALFQPPANSEKDFTNYSRRRSTIRAIEADTAKPEEKEAFLAALSAAIDATANASNALRASLDEAGGWDQFVKVRDEWADAIEMPDSEEKTKALEEVQKRIVALLKPWLDKLQAHKAALAKEAKERFDVDITLDTPEVKPLRAAEKPLHTLAAKLAKKPDTKLTEKELTLIAAAAGRTGFTLPDPLTSEALSKLADAVLTWRKSSERELAKRKRASDLDASYWWDKQLENRLLNDKAYLFGKLGYKKTKDPTQKERTWGESVDQPGAGQMLHRGWFRIAEPGTTSATPSKEFILEMAQHGFDLGATWGVSDSMHYEVAV